MQSKRKSKKGAGEMKVRPIRLPSNDLPSNKIVGMIQGSGLGSNSFSQSFANPHSTRRGYGYLASGYGFKAPGY